MTAHSYPCAGDLWRGGAPARGCPRPAEVAVCDRVRVPAGDGEHEHSILVVVFACPRHLRDVQLWVDRHQPGPAASGSGAVRLPARLGAAAVRNARAAGAGGRWEVLTNLGRPASLD